MAGEIRALLDAVDDLATRLDVGYTINTAELRQLAAAVREEMAARDEASLGREPAACELKPCPFCGADGTIVQADNDVAWYIVECAGTINCAMRPRCESDSYDALVSAWNTRAVERWVKAELMGEEKP